MHETTGVSWACGRDFLSGGSLVLCHSMYLNRDVCYPITVVHTCFHLFVIHRLFSAWCIGWWFVAKGQEEGWVPCSYLEPLNGGQEEDDTISSLGIATYTMSSCCTNGFRAVCLNLPFRQPISLPQELFQYSLSLPPHHLLHPYSTQTVISVGKEEYNRSLLAHNLSQTNSPRILLLYLQ